MQFNVAKVETRTTSRLKTIDFTKYDVFAWTLHHSSSIRNKHSKDFDPTHHRHHQRFPSKEPFS
jgi:hypothetical protein